MRNFTWKRFPIKNLLIDSVLTPIVESTYLNRDTCKFESSQKDESRWQSTDFSKAYRNTSAFKCAYLQCNTIKIAAQRWSTGMWATKINAWFRVWLNRVLNRCPAYRSGGSEREFKCFQCEAGAGLNLHVPVACRLWWLEQETLWLTISTPDVWKQRSRWKTRLPIQRSTLRRLLWKQGELHNKSTCRAMNKIGKKDKRPSHGIDSGRSSAETCSFQSQFHENWEIEMNRNADFADALASFMEKLPVVLRKLFSIFLYPDVFFHIEEEAFLCYSCTLQNPSWNHQRNYKRNKKRFT